jgi:UDP-glucose 4-epimerase
VRIVVTGGAGFIGSNVVDRYLALGHDVWVVDNLSSGHPANVNPRAQLVRMDVRSAEIGPLLREIEPDVVNHHAAQIDVRKSVADPRFDIEVNVVGTINLLEAAAAARAKRFIFASSGGAGYGEQLYFPADEAHPTDPVSPYGINKLAAEKYIQYYAAGRFKAVLLRYANVYGPRQDPNGEAGVVSIFGRRLIAGDTCTIFGDGRQTRDYVFVGDVVRANELGLDAAAAGVYNVGTGRETDVNALYAALALAAGSKAPAQYAPPRPGEQMRSCLASKRLAAQFGWSPDTTLAAGLAATLAHFRTTVGR